MPAATIVLQRYLRLLICAGPLHCGRLFRHRRSTKPSVPAVNATSRTAPVSPATSCTSPMLQPYTAGLSTANTPPDIPPDFDITKGLASTPLQSINLETGVDGNIPVRLEGFKHLGLYGLVDPPQPAILVPGSPRDWRERPLPFRVPFDSGLNVLDPNTPHRLGIGRVLEDQLEQISTNLTRSADAYALQQIRAGTGGGRRGKRTRLRREKMMLVERWDTRMCQYAQPPKFGCRSTFDEAATAPKRNRQSSKFCNHVVQYDVEGRMLIVGSEVDACIRDDEDLVDLLASRSPSSPSSHPPSCPAYPQYSLLHPSHRAVYMVAPTSLKHHLSRPRHGFP
ncbi:hypothetical protein C8Q77DRAFT_1234681 [Trametes polyzona]|nr:hypothetical protein C8Q77DRAFT_1234681 [Trametes polyzona]